MGSLKDNFIKKFIMSLLWSVDKPEGSEKPEKSPENLENSDSEGEEKSPEKKSTEERTGKIQISSRRFGRLGF